MKILEPNRRATTSGPQIHISKRIDSVTNIQYKCDVKAAMSDLNYESVDYYHPFDIDRILFKQTKSNKICNKPLALYSRILHYSYNVYEL